MGERHEGQGPVTPAKEAGTSSWIPQAGQLKRILSEFMPVGESSYTVILSPSARWSTRDCVASEAIDFGLGEMGVIRCESIFPIHNEGIAISGWARS